MSLTVGCTLPSAPKLGLGTAYIFGFKVGAQRGYAFIFGWTPIFRIIPRICFGFTRPARKVAQTLLLAPLCTWWEGGELPWDRIFISKGGALYPSSSRVCPCRNPLLDSCAIGVRCWKLPMDEVQFIGYAFQIEMKYAPGNWASS
jgi:dolichol-phosphate mannosyltransferase